MSHRAQAQRAGTYRQQPNGYRAFSPAAFPPATLSIEGHLLRALTAADRDIGRLVGTSQMVPSAELFLRMYLLQEAVLSSQIEGTQASMMDVLEYQAGIADSERQSDAQETENYLDALRFGLHRIQTLPLSLRLIRETHEVLMRKVRGGEGVKTPGAFRTSQNWIAGRSPVDAVFVPPPVPEMQEALGQLERSFHPPIFHQYPDLISVGLIHSQFETIHPFLDGNGRMGRLLITFLLCAHKVLDHPLLYLSIYFNRNRKAYYEHLQAVRDEGAWEPWLHFFLIGVSEVAREATTMAHQIVVLRESLRTRITDQLKSRASNGLRVLEALFGDPVVDVKKVEKLLGCSQPTALHLVDDLHGMGLLRELTGRRRGRIFLFRPYVDLFQASGG